MKKIILSITAVLSLILTSCADLDLNPLTDASSGTWFSSAEEFEYACNDLYRTDLWVWECNRAWHTDRWTDDWDQQAHSYEWISGAVMSTTDYVRTMWLNTYKAITRCNAIIAGADRQRGHLSDAVLDKYEGEALFFRGCFYSYLTFLYGDIPFFQDYITIDDAYAKGRTPRSEIIKAVYADFDRAAQLLPEKNTGENIRVIRAAAYALKARTASWFLDYRVAAEAAKACMECGSYSLDPDFEHLFYASTYSSPEFIFMIARNRELLSSDKLISMSSFLPRNNGGKALAAPSLELFSCYLCTDGLPIDKSPLFDRTEPFKNRDPRLGYTMPEFGSVFLGIEWNPLQTKVMNHTTGKSITNNDSQLSRTDASWTGMILKKGMNEEVLVDKKLDPNHIIMRYADLLLIYAEAKIELDEIDQSVLDAINDVRARAYKTTRTNTSAYPAVTTNSQSELRFILRTERHMELAWENRRWFDLMRWRLCEIAINRPTVGIPTKVQLNSNIKKGNVFFSADGIPEIEENGLVNLLPCINSTAKFRKTMERKFDPAKGYLLPLPLSDVTLIPGMTQNPGY